MISTVMSLMVRQMYYESRHSMVSNNARHCTFLVQFAYLEFPGVEEGDVELVSLPLGPAAVLLETLDIETVPDLLEDLMQEPSNQPKSSTVDWAIRTSMLKMKLLLKMRSY